MNSLATDAVPQRFDATHLEERAFDLECTLGQMLEGAPGDITEHFLYGVCLSRFDTVLEQCGKLVRKRVGDHYPTNMQADRLTFKGLFRQAVKLDLLDDETAERWCRYRDLRNDEDQAYDKDFSEAFARLVPEFVKDAKLLVERLQASQFLSQDNGNNAAIDSASPAKPGRSLFLNPRYRALLDALLQKHLPDIEVWAYGSRINGRAHEGSDLDLVLRGPDLEKIPFSRLEGFNEALENSNIPILVEARDWACLPERFHREIERDYVVLRSPSASKETKGA